MKYFENYGKNSNHDILVGSLNYLNGWWSNFLMIFTTVYRFILWILYVLNDELVIKNYIWFITAWIMISGIWSWSSARRKGISRWPGNFRKNWWSSTKKNSIFHFICWKFRWPWITWSIIPFDYYLISNIFLLLYNYQKHLLLHQ